MVKEILDQYEKKEIKLPKWILGYSEQGQIEYQIREKKNYLTEKLTEYFTQQKVKWAIDDSKDIAIAVNGNFLFVIQRLRGSYSSRYIGGKTHDYLLIIFEDEKEIFSLRDFCDHADYNSNSCKIPMLDLYDIVTMGEKRKQPPAHVCGAQGFNPMLGDKCPAC